MINNAKFKRMEKRSRVYKAVGFSTNIIGNLPAVKHNEKLSGVLTTVGCTSSVASVVNFLRSLEKYDMSEEGEEYVFLKDFLLNFVTSSILDSLALGWSMSSDEYKRETLKKLNIPSNIIDVLI